MSFFWLRTWYFPQYELSNLLKERPEIKPHPAFPVYAVAYYPLRWLAAHDWSLAPREPKSYVGKVRKFDRRIGRNSIYLDTEHSTLSIGFICEPPVCSQLDNIKPDDFVEVQFGSALVSDSDKLVGILLEVNKCENQGSRCDAARERQSQEHSETQRATEALQNKWKECRTAINATLLADSRYLQPEQSGQQGAAFDKYNLLTGEQKACAETALKNHTQAVFDSCEKHHCGDDIGGGCAHIAGHGQTGTLSSALKKCGI